jgi:ribonuclease Z
MKNSQRGSILKFVQLVKLMVWNLWFCAFTLGSHQAYAVSLEQSDSAVIKVTLLGTGTPAVRAHRSGPSTMVRAGDETLLFDVGRGTALRLQQAGVSFDQVDEVFLTHLHSDHLVGLPDLWLSGWVLGRRDQALNIRGPRGTKSMMAHLAQAFSYDIDIRSKGSTKLALDGIETVVTEIKEGVVYQKNGLTVTAFAVDHSPVKPAFGFRVDYRGRSLAISGDTRYSENLIKHAKGVDVLIHEVAYANAVERQNPFLRYVVSTHTTPQEAAQIFSATRPRLAVYTHVITWDVSSDAQLVPETMKTYPGEVIVGEDLMGIEIGDEIRVLPR